MSLTAAVIGVGHLGRHHARVLKELKDVDLVAVCDTDEKAGRKIAKKNKAEYVSDYRELIGKVDAVSIVVPTVLHHEIGKAFIEAGTHTLLEKPMCKTVEQAKEILALSKEKGVTLAVGHIERFNPVMIGVQEYLGKPSYIECHRISPYPFRASDVGVVLDIMIHDLDIILHIVDSPVKEIHAIGGTVIGMGEDIANARIEFENGAVATLTASRVSIKQMRKVRLFQKDCYISLDFAKKDGVVWRKAPGVDVAKIDIDELRKRKQEDPSSVDFKDYVQFIPVKISKKEPLKAELESFIQAINTQTSPVVTGEHGVRALETAEQIIKAIEKKTWR